jgi:SNF2 family DNA or RNA helicase
VLNESANQPNHVTNLVVCPTSLTYNWLAEIKKFFTDVNAAVIDGTDRNLIIE